MLGIFVLLSIMKTLHGVSGDTPSGLNFSGPSHLEDVLIFTCTTIGQGATVWQGTVFDCKFKNEVTLLHSKFNSYTKEIRFCNNETIVARSLNVENNHYTSQLNVTINSVFNLIGETIECAHDDGTVAHVIGCCTLNELDGDLICTNYSNISDKGNGHNSVSIATAAIVITVGSVIIAAGIVFGIMMKKLLAHRSSFSITLEQKPVEVEACASSTAIGMKLKACDNESLHPAELDSDHIMMRVEELPTKSCDIDCYLNDREEQLDLDSLLMKLRGTVDVKLWYQFGMTLGVPRDTLDELSGYDEDQCLIEVADYWLRNHPTKPTWSEICDATKIFKPMNDHAVTQDMPGSVMHGACPPNSMILNYTAVIPKSLRSRLQRSTSPPPIPPRMEQQLSTQSSAVPPRPPNP